MSAIEIPGYKIVRTLGVGGQATVYLAIQQGFDREVALKVMSPALAADPTFGERFVREAKIVAKLSHKSIVTVYDVGESGNFYYLAMEYLPGGDLKKRISDGMKARECLAIISKIANALHFAHEKGYIHRDVKSENILFDRDNEPLLTDFGIAKASNSSTQMTQTGKLIGTPEYMSPEQCRGKTVDGRSDLYSLGIILFEMLTKGVPFSGEDSVAVCIKHVTKPIPELPARLKHFQWLLELLLAKEPAKRVQTGVELVKVISDFKDTGKRTEVPKAEAPPIKKSRAKKQSIQKTVATNKLDEHDDFDDLHSERRFHVQEKEPKNKVPLFVSIILLTLLGIGGFFTKDRWLPATMAWFDENISGNAASEKSTSTAEQKSDKTVSTDSGGPNSATQTDSGSENLSANKNGGQSVSGSESNGVKRTANVEELLQEADTLVQFLPQKLDDIKQALKLLATVNTLQPENKNAQLIYQNIISVSLSEATTLAENNNFEQAGEWIALVEYEQPQHTLLDATKQNIARLKVDFESKVKEREQSQIKIDELISQGNLALKEERLSSPQDNNAIYYFQQVLKLEPQNQNAKEGLEQVTDTYANLVEAAISENTYSRARTLLARFSSLSDDEAKKVSLRQKITQGEKAYNIARKERQRLAAIAEKKKQAESERQARLSDPLVQMRLQGSLDAAKALEQQNLLVEPEENNALAKYRLALEMDDRNEEAKNGVVRIEQAVLSGLTNSIAASNKSEAFKWLNKLKLFDANHPQYASFNRAVEDIIEITPQTEEKLPTDSENNNTTLDINEAELSVDSSEPINSTEGESNSASTEAADELLPQESKTADETAVKAELPPETKPLSEVGSNSGDELNTEESSADQNPPPVEQQSEQKNEDKDKDDPPSAS
ncbi:serine/threonine protein kinase [Aliikangiella coralliicola]|uniref:serine/threonine protein kinase n=1 Tax=Aliikangiella coralliicola TaxID=2592383 RepID=UPI00143DF1FE|nr:serine/threonine-protein kinase [Aliikangiella coralliicola]